MTSHSPVLHLLCGKIASGKSTLAARLAAAPHTVLIAEDDWLAALYPDEIATPADYLRASTRLQAAMTPHVAALLTAGTSVVLDFPANTPATRAWMRKVIARSGAAHELHLLEISDATCLARLQARNAAGDHPFAATEDEFHRFTKHFTPPGEEEGFTITRHPASPT